MFKSFWWIESFGRACWGVDLNNSFSHLWQTSAILLRNSLQPNALCSSALTATWQRCTLEGGKKMTAIIISICLHKHRPHGRLMTGNAQQALSSSVSAGARIDYWNYLCRDLRCIFEAASSERWDRSEVAEIFGPCAKKRLRCIDLHKVEGVHLEAAVMQSQHGVPSALTAAPVHGQYGYVSVLLTTTEQAVLALYLCPPPTLQPSTCALSVSVCAEVCQMSWKQETLKAPSATKHPSSVSTDQFPTAVFDLCEVGVYRWACIGLHSHISACMTSCHMNHHDATTMQCNKAKPLPLSCPHKEKKETFGWKTRRCVTARSMRTHR